MVSTTWNLLFFCDRLLRTSTIKSESYPPSTKNRTTRSDESGFPQHLMHVGNVQPDAGDWSLLQQRQCEDLATLHANRALHRLKYAAMTRPCKSWDDSCALVFAEAPRKSSFLRPPTDLPFGASTTNLALPPSPVSSGFSSPSACERRGEPQSETILDADRSH